MLLQVFRSLIIHRGNVINLTKKINIQICSDIQQFWVENISNRNHIYTLWKKNQTIKEKKHFTTKKELEQYG
jgi:hypothetical protein